MKLVYVNETSEKIIEKKLQDLLNKIGQKLLGRELITPETLEKEISLVFLDKNLAKRINWQYRQKDYATDILSFSSDDAESFGELVMCPEVLHEQAKQHKQSFEDELSYMVLHGILHLLGFDHERGPEEAEKMFKIQDSIFAEMTSSQSKVQKKSRDSSPVAKSTKSIKAVKNKTIKKVVSKKKIQKKNKK